MIEILIKRKIQLTKNQNGGMIIKVFIKKKIIFSKYLYFFIFIQGNLISKTNRYQCLFSKYYIIYL